MSWHTLLLVLVLTLTVERCTTKVAGLQVSESFDYGALQRERFLVGGVTQAGQEDVDKVSSQYSGDLRTELIEERKEIKIGPTAEFANEMGRAESKTVLEGFNRSASLDSKSIAEIAAKIKDFRYVVFARIENDTTTISRRETPAREIQDGKGHSHWEPGDVSVENQRSVTASMYVVDLKEKNSAFSGSVTKAGHNTSNYTKSLGGTIVSVVQAAKGNDPYPAPNPPSTGEVLRNAFKGFAENFPEED